MIIQVHKSWWNTGWVKTKGAKPKRTQNKPSYQIQDVWIEWLQQLLSPWPDVVPDWLTGCWRSKLQPMAVQVEEQVPDVDEVQSFHCYFHWNYYVCKLPSSEHLLWHCCNVHSPPNEPMSQMHGLMLPLV